MYIATKDLNEIKKGDVVPDRIAEDWILRYAKPCVEKVDGQRDEGGQRDEVPEDKKEETENNFDLNDDGVVDDKDVSLAAKVMGSMRGRKRKEK